MIKSDWGFALLFTWVLLLLGVVDGLVASHLFGGNPLIYAGYGAILTPIIFFGGICLLVGITWVFDKIKYKRNRNKSYRFY